MANDNEAPIYINTVELRRLSRKTNDIAIVGVAMTLLGYGNCQAFKWDVPSVCRYVNEHAPNDRMTPERLTAMIPGLLLFFVALPDGRWAPNPAVFSAVDGNPGTES